MSLCSYLVVSICFQAMWTLFICYNSPNQSPRLCKNHTWKNVIKMVSFGLGAHLMSPLECNSVRGSHGTSRYSENSWNPTAKTMIHCSNTKSIWQTVVWKPQSWLLLRLWMGPVELAAVLPTRTTLKRRHPSSLDLFRPSFSYFLTGFASQYTFLE